jgi:hypothetical protein
VTFVSSDNKIANAASEFIFKRERQKEKEREKTTIGMVVTVPFSWGGGGARKYYPILKVPSQCPLAFLVERSLWEGKALKYLHIK